MSDDFITVLAKTGDLEKLSIIENSCFRNPWSDAQIKEELENPNARYYIVQSAGGEFCGSIGCWMLPPYECQIGKVAVLPKMRGRGLGRLLVDRLISECKSLGISEISLEVRQSNEAAIALYTRCGFIAAGKRPGYYSDGETAIIMLLSIDC